MPNCLFPLVLALLPVTGAVSASAQVYTYDFGTGTASYTTAGGVSTTTLPQPSPSPAAGDEYIRVGSGGGGFALENAGNTNLGTGSELAITASSSTSVNKFAIVNHNGSTFSQLSFSTVLSGNDGVFTAYTGNGSSFDSTGTVPATGDTFLGLRFALAGTAESPTVTTTYNNSGNFVSTGLTTTGITVGSVLSFDIFQNNTTTETAYTFGGQTFTLAANSFDIYLAGAIIGNDLVSGGLADGSAIDSLAFTGGSSTGNVGIMRLDDLAYGAFTPVPEPSTWAAGLLTLAALGFTQRKRFAKPTSPIS